MGERFTFELDLPPGIFPDETAFSMKGRWANCNNICWDNESGRPKTIGGSIAWLSGFADPVRAMYNAGYSSPSNVTRVAYGVASAVTTNLYYSTIGSGSLTNITPVSGFTTARFAISLATFGATLLAAPAHGTLFEWSGSGLATAVTNAPDEIVRMLASSEFRQVLAFGCNEEISGTFNTRCIRGCDLEDYADWTTSPTNNAFEDILPSDSAIIGAEWVGSYVAVWTETSLFMGQFIGDPGQVWRWEHVASGCGLLEQRSAAVVGNTAYWMSQDGRFLRWSPGASVAEIPCPIARDFRENFNIASSSTSAQRKRDTAFMASVPSKGEIWFFYNDDRDAATTQLNPTRYMAVNLKHGAWFRGDLQRSSMYDLAGFYKVQGGALNTVLLGENGTTVSQMVEGNAAVNWFLQTADQYFDSGRRRIMVTGCEPDFEVQSANVSLTLFCRSYPQGDVITKGPYTLAAGADKSDFRASGKIIAVKFSGSSANAKLGRPTFDCVTMGER